MAETKVTSNEIYSPVNFSVYRNAALNSTNSYSVVQFDAKLWDSGNNVDITTNKGRFTAPYPGFLRVSAAVGNTAATSTAMGIAIYKNGSVYKVGGFGDPSLATSSGNKYQVVGSVSCTTNDYVEIYFIGGNGSVIEVGATACWFEGYYSSGT